MPEFQIAEIVQLGEKYIMGDWSPLEEDVLLKGMLTVIVHLPDGRPARGRSVKILGCGFV